LPPAVADGYQGLFDSTGAATDISVRMTGGNPQWTYYANNQPIPNLPETIAKNVAYGHDGPRNLMEFTFTGLDQNYTYTFTIYASISNVTDTRSGLYTAEG